MNLYKHEFGSGTEALVLVHGWGMNLAVWEPLLPALSAHYRLTLLELPGHGASAPADHADLGQWAQACLQAAPPRARWLGWSLGGQVAIRAALDAPHRITALLLVGVTPRFVQADDWPCAMPVTTFGQFAAALHDDPQATLLRFLGLQVKGTAHARETLRLLRDEIARRPAASAAGLAQGLDLLLGTDLRQALRRLACASLWIFGGRDTLVPLAVKDRLPGLVPDARSVAIDGAGHAPFLSHPQQCLDLFGAAGLSV